MCDTPISFAAVFTKNDEKDPLCSICFFVERKKGNSEDDVLRYLAQDVMLRLARIIPNSNSETVSSAIRLAVSEMEEKFGVRCVGILTDCNLDVTNRTAAAGGMSEAGGLPRTARRKQEDSKEFSQEGTDEKQKGIPERVHMGTSFQTAPQPTFQPSSQPASQPGFQTIFLSISLPATSLAVNSNYFRAAMIRFPNGQAEAVIEHLCKREIIEDLARILDEKGNRQWRELERFEREMKEQGCPAEIYPISVVGYCFVETEKG